MMLEIIMHCSCNTPETWRPIPGFGMYDVSTCGRIRRARARDGKPLQTPREMSLVLGHAGYMVVGLSGDAGKKMARVHRLVASAFCQPNGATLVLHGDGVRDNNHASNLRFGTSKENTADSIRHGTLARQWGERNGQARVTEADVPVIRSRYAAGERLSAIASDYGITKSGAHLIATRKNWSHVQ